MGYTFTHQYSKCFDAREKIALNLLRCNKSAISRKIIYEKNLSHAAIT